MAEILRLQAIAGNRAVRRLLCTVRAPARTLQRVTTGTTLEADKAYARAVVDPLLKQYFIGQDLTSAGNELEKRKKARILALMQGVVPDEMYLDKLQEAEASARAEFQDEDAQFALLTAAYQEGERISRGMDITAVGDFGADFLSNPAYWGKKAKRARTNRTSVGERVALWCDHATALVVDRLAADPGFTSSLDVIKQGDPHVSGHWYVLANREQAPVYGRQLTRNEFIIDLWGAVRLNLETTVFDADSPHLKDGALHLFPIEKIESVMTVPGKEQKEGIDLLDELLGELEEEKQAKSPAPGSGAAASGSSLGNA